MIPDPIKSNVEIPVWAQQNPNMLPEFLKTCEEYAFENQARKWVEFYANTYGLSAPYLEDLCAEKIKEGVIGPRDKMMRLIFLPETTLAQDIVVLEKMSGIYWGVGKQQVFDADFSNEDLSRKNFLWTYDDLESEDRGINSSFNNMCGSKFSLMGFKTRIIWESFTCYCNPKAEGAERLDTKSFTMTRALCSDPSVFDSVLRVSRYIGHGEVRISMVSKSLINRQSFFRVVQYF